MDMAEWVKVAEFAKLAGITRQSVYDKIKEYPRYAKKIENVNRVSTDLLDVLAGKAPAAEELDSEPLATTWPDEPAQTVVPEESEIDKARQEIEALRAELAQERRKNDELSRQILDIVKKSQEQTDKILQIADQAQQLERGSQLLLQDKTDKQGFFKRLFGKA